MRSYVEIDRSLPDLPLRERLPTSIDGTYAPSLEELSRNFRVLFQDAVMPLEMKIFNGERLNVKHGPGATAERVMFNDKFRWTQWTERLAKIFHPDSYIHAMEHVSGWDQGSYPIPLEAVAPEHETPVRVIHVPKTMKTPRIIAIEPVLMQFMQQGLLDGLTKGVKSSFIGTSTLFDDQSVNATRALKGSKDGHNATLDLSEASDRVSFDVVDALFRPWFPNVMEALDATRSRRARVPGSFAKSDVLVAQDVPESFTDCGLSAPGELHRVSSGRKHVRALPAGRVREAVGRGSSKSGRSRGVPAPELVVELRKFASMGSAVCFPVEAMVFTTIVFTAVADFRGLSLTPRSARLIAPTVSVFGDDIIVPVDAAPLVAAYLEAYGLKVNRKKSFWTGRFRESCGTDAFQGEPVTPAYLKTFDFGDRHALDWLALWVEFSNTLYEKGFWETSRTIRKRIAHLGYRIPTVSATSPAVGYHNVRGTYEWQSWDKNLQRPAVRSYTYRSKRIETLLDGPAAMRKCLTTPFNEDRDHLRSAVRSASVSTKKRWTSPY